MTLAEILNRLARLSCTQAPTVRLPYGVAYAAGVASTAWANVTGSEPRLPLDAVRMARKKMFVSHDKAKRELGFAPSAVDGAMARQIERFSHNICTYRGNFCLNPLSLTSIRAMAHALPLPRDATSLS